MNINELVVSEWISSAVEDLGCASVYTTIRYPPFGNLTEHDMKQAIKNASQILEFTKSKLAEMGFV